VDLRTGARYDAFPSELLPAPPPVEPPVLVGGFAAVVEAERERRAKIINAEGELQAAKQLDEAAAILAQRPETMQLRYLGTLSEFATSKGASTIVLPLPLDMLKNAADLLGKR
jgi:regulator of protease activity HflC (stomatin/prohibitin superfamily)